MLSVNKQCIAALVEVNAGRLCGAIGKTCESNHGLGRSMRAAMARRRYPDIVSTAGSWGCCWIFGDVEVAVLVERKVVGKFKISRRIEADFYVVVHERCVMTTTAVRLAKINREDSIVTRTCDGNVKRIGAASIIPG